MRIRLSCGDQGLVFPQSSEMLLDAARYCSKLTRFMELSMPRMVMRLTTSRCFKNQESTSILSRI